MSNNRVETLKNMVAQNPADSFARYGLAMEYANLGELEQALDEYKALLETNPDYAAGYYHGGRTLEKLGRSDEAREMYQRGIEVTTRIGDMHTRSELQAALDILGYGPSPA
ncbi:MAG: tetratricopeptide repeat protein [Bryobacteraceae bacterium]